MTAQDLAQEIGHGIYFLDAEYIQPGIAGLYVMLEGESVAIIETGTTHSLPLIEQALTALERSFEDVRYVIPTHVHLDHAGGAGALMRVCPKAELVIHPLGAAHMIDPGRLIAGTRAVYGDENTEKFYGEIVPVPAERVIEANDRFTLDFNGRELLFIDTPGHALHHFCVIDAKSEGVFTGDTFGIVYPEFTDSSGVHVYATTTPTQFDPEALQASIARVMSYHPKRAYLTHFGAVTITPRLVRQLTESVSGLANVSREWLGKPANRLPQLEQVVEDYLVALLKKYGCQLEEGAMRRRLYGDVKLNSQGLDVWLQRQEKRVAERFS